MPWICTYQIKLEKYIKTQNFVLDFCSIRYKYRAEYEQTYVDFGMM